MTEAHPDRHRTWQEIRGAARKGRRVVANTIGAWTEAAPLEAIGSPTVHPDPWVPDTRTGGILITVDPAADMDAVLSSLSRSAGIKTIANGRELLHEQSPDMDAVVLERSRVIIVPERDDPIPMDRLSSDLTGVRLEPERYQWATEVSPAWVRGYREGVNDLCDHIAAADGAQETQEHGLVGGYADSLALSWGLQALGGNRRDATGAGIRVAVLDTGISKTHPSLSAHIKDAQSFVPGESVDDLRGHGTHCAGVICGDQSDAPFRFGVTPEVELFVGKVLSDAGTGKDGYILAGMDWAIDSGCHVISMSLGSDVPVPSHAYERIASEALDSGVLVIAAAGNNGDRPYGPGFVGQPANADSILAIGAVDQQLRVASFSSGGVRGTVRTYPNLAAPGVRILSSWPEPPRYRTCDGTSMACPHAAGAAAAWAGVTGLRGHALWGALLGNVKQLADHQADIGKGLVQLP